MISSKKENEDVRYFFTLDFFFLVWFQTLQISASFHLCVTNAP